MVRAYLVGGLLVVAPLQAVNSEPVPRPGVDMTQVERSKLEGIRALVRQCRPLPPLPMANPRNPTPLDRAMIQSNARAIAQALRTIQQRLAANGTTGFATEAGAAEYKASLMELVHCYYGEQMDRATAEAIRGGLGATSTWISEGDPNISGKSVVTAEEKLADGGQCLTVTDVVIIDGEETTVPKRMCRAAGASAYVKA